ncbi:SUF system NifU family Fe-S cluster assembly protein [bacterium]|nr:SUF system NifU family Fe-S cluster assembly protein [bacterium]
MDLKTLYREVIVDHYKKPRNSTPLDHPDVEAKCKNPSCGDRVTLQLRFANDNLAEIGFIGVGCAISQASTSMMTQAVKGKSREEVRQIMTAFREMVVEGAEQPDAEALGDLVTMQGIAKLPARVKCAMCGWSALEAALDEQSEEVDMDQDTSMPEAKRGGGM